MVKSSSVQGGVVDLHGAMTSISTLQKFLSSADSSRVPKAVEAFRGLTLPRNLLDFAIPIIFGSLKYSDHPEVVRSLLNLVNTLAVCRAHLPTRGKVQLERDEKFKYSNVQSGELRSLRVEETTPPAGHAAVEPPAYLLGGVNGFLRDEAFFRVCTWEWLEEKASRHDVGFEWYKKKGVNYMSLEDYVDLIVERVLLAHRSLRAALPNPSPEVPEYGAVAEEEEEEVEEEAEEGVQEPGEEAAPGVDASTSLLSRKTVRARAAAPDLDVLVPYFDSIYGRMSNLKPNDPDSEASAIKIFKSVLVKSIPDSEEHAVAALLLPPGLWKRGKLQVAKLVDVGAAHVQHTMFLYGWDEVYEEYQALEADLIDTRE